MYLVGLLLFIAQLAGCAASLPRGAVLPPGYPMGYHERGMASWYGPGFDGRQTASGERFDMRQLTAAHRTLPFGSIVQVRSLMNDRRVIVRINDRGPFSRGRILDLSRGAASQLGMIGQGTHQVELNVIAYHGTSDEVGALWVQVASFAERELAQAFMTSLNKSYRDVRIIAIELPSGMRYRVQVGRFASEQEAAAMAKRIDRQFQVESVVVREKT
ncbi:MAG TPA: septal ring lytic transglycosylase RlpA family protein [Nitrospira sp.]|jgi:rare lipoprotein A|nr:septal ring lytic transglycosylase RlpA family protein [Nitrospira sp.]